MAVIILIELYIILTLVSQLSCLRDRLLTEMKDNTLIKSKHQSRMPIEMTEIEGENDGQDGSN